jgi:3-(3-hydroxy-phenyl)propionate hydroxylase
MDEIFPAGWKIIFSSQAGAECLRATSTHHLSHLQVAQIGVGQLVELENVLANWFAKHAVVAAIVRPDHYIYGVCANANDVMQQLDALKLL